MQQKYFVFHFRPLGILTLEVKVDAQPNLLAPDDRGGLTGLGGLIDQEDLAGLQ